MGEAKGEVAGLVDGTSGRTMAIAVSGIVLLAKGVKLAHQRVPVLLIGAGCCL